MSCTQYNFPMIIPFTNSDMIANGVHNSSTPRNERKNSLYNKGFSCQLTGLNNRFHLILPVYGSIDFHTIQALPTIYSSGKSPQ